MLSTAKKSNRLLVGSLERECNLVACDKAVSVDFLITRFFSNLTGSDWVNPYKIRQKNIYIYIYCIYKFQKSVANLNQRYVALQEGRFLLPFVGRDSSGYWATGRNFA